MLDFNFEEPLFYYVGLTTNSNLKLTTKDNFSNWNDNFSTTISFPIFNFNEPIYLYNTNPNNINISIKGFSHFSSHGINRSLKSLNESIKNNYAQILHLNTIDYNIGKSFLTRLFNISFKPYKNLLNYWNFNNDYNLKTIQNLKSSNALDYGNLNINENPNLNLNANFYGNTFLYLNFDILQNNAKDLTNYNHNIISTHNSNCNIKRFSNNNQSACKFNSNSNYIEISKETFNLNKTNNLSFSTWIKLSETKKSDIFLYGNSTHKINFGILENGQLYLNLTNSTQIIELKTNLTLKRNQWSLIGFYIKSNNSSNTPQTQAQIFLNDKFSILQKGNYIKHFPKSTQNIKISNHGNKFLNATIDETIIYIDQFNKLDLQKNFNTLKPHFINYKTSNSKLKKSLFFDGKNDYLNTSYNNLNIYNWTLSFWIKFNDNNKNKQTIFNFKNSSSNILQILKTKNNILINSSNHKLNISLINSKSKLNKNWNHFIITNLQNSSNSKFKLYLNGKNLNTTNTNIKISNLKTLTIGKEQNKNYFKGELDEIRFYNRTWNNLEIINSYKNYDAFLGNANYFSLINPNKLGYNNTLYLKNISYTDFNFYNKKQNYNFTLYKLINFSSNQTSKNYYNLLFDHCADKTFNLGAISILSNNHSKKKIKEGKDNSCQDLVYQGIY